jgi:hypothetical protein
MFNVLEEHYVFILINFSNGKCRALPAFILGEIQAMLLVGLAQHFFMQRILINLIFVSLRM